MCGINGVFSLTHNNVGPLEDLVETMNDLIRHRGPDDEGVWNSPDEHVCFGQRRLTIIELSDLGHQPMVLDDGTAIVFNGEIYNFEELKKTLPDYHFKSNSDTEVILALYKKYGKKCLEKLVGMFAFAIWDPNEDGLFIARDHIGKKPLYYTERDQGFAFSSEVRSLLSLPWVDNELDRKALYQFLTFGFLAAPLTMFEGIKKLHPGHYLWITSKAGCSNPIQYWSVNPVNTASNEQDAILDLREKLDHSVDLRMVSDVPVGIFLSGGVDSTGIAKMMRARTDAPIHSFSIGFEGQPDYDETASARATADSLGFIHHEYIVTPSDMREMMAKIVDVFDEPLADPTVIPIYFLSKIAHDRGIKVILTGDGPDELLLGYKNWQQYIKLYPIYTVFKGLPKLVRRAAYSFAKKRIKSARTVEIFYRALLGQELFWGNAPSFKESEKADLLHPNFLELAKNWDCHDVIDQFRQDYDRSFLKKNNNENWMSYIGLRHIIPNFYLHRADRLGMQHGVELRAPFLDYDFASYALSIPPALKVKNNEPKYILKKLFAPLISDDVLYRKKQGFCVPLREWGAEIMLDTIAQELPSLLSRYDIFNEAAILRQIEQFRNGDDSLTNNIWTLYFITIWIKKWV